MDIQERIVLKAHELFMRYGIRSVSMDEIANHLGMSKKTIYQFFADKDALVESVIDIEISRTREDCTAYRQKSENPIHEIFLAVEMLQELLKSMNPSLMFDLEKYHARAFQKISEHKNRFLYDVIKSNLEKGIRDELYRDQYGYHDPLPAGHYIPFVQPGVVLSRKVYIAAGDGRDHG